MYRVGKKQRRVILDANGHEVAHFVEGKEKQAALACKLMNEHEKGLIAYTGKYKGLSMPITSKEFEFNREQLKSDVKVEVMREMRDKRRRAKEQASKDKKTLLEKVEDYFKNTPREQIDRDWEETKIHDSVGPTIEEFLSATHKVVQVPQVGQIWFNDEHQYAIEVSKVGSNYVICDFTTMNIAKTTAKIYAAAMDGDCDDFYLSNDTLFSEFQLLDGAAVERSSEKDEKQKIKLGDELIINTNELQDEKVVVVDLTSDGVPFCEGDNFEGWIPMIKRSAQVTDQASKDKKTLLEKVEDYFENTPKEQIDRDWEESKRHDSIGPTAEEFLSSSYDVQVGDIREYDCTAFPMYKEWVVLSIINDVAHIVPNVNKGVEAHDYVSIDVLQDQSNLIERKPLSNSPIAGEWYVNKNTGDLWKVQDVRYSIKEELFFVDICHASGELDRWILNDFNRLFVAKSAIDKKSEAEQNTGVRKGDIYLDRLDNSIFEVVAFINGRWEIIHLKCYEVTTRKNGACYFGYILDNCTLIHRDGVTLNITSEIKGLQEQTGQSNTSEDGQTVIDTDIRKGDVYLDRSDDGIFEVECRGDDFNGHATFVVVFLRTRGMHGRSVIADVYIRNNCKLIHRP